VSTSERGKTITKSVADGHHPLPSTYLLRMPRWALFGQARDIERWCRQNGKALPTLLDLGLARREVNKANKANYKKKERNRK
jgi:hypothetical protein